MSIYKKTATLSLDVTSKYAQKMRRLSCKIFNEFYVPELSKKEAEYNEHHAPIVEWFVKWRSDLRVFDRNKLRPFDLDESRNWKYYPAHPQYRQLIHELREYGLYRDEHRDLREEMKLRAIAKGKVFREVRGPMQDNKKKK